MITVHKILAVNGKQWEPIVAAILARGTGPVTDRDIPLKQALKEFGIQAEPVQDAILTSGGKHPDFLVRLNVCADITAPDSWWMDVGFLGNKPVDGTGWGASKRFIITDYAKLRAVCKKQTVGTYGDWRAFFSEIREKLPYISELVLSE